MVIRKPRRPLPAVLPVGSAGPSTPADGLLSAGGTPAVGSSTAVKVPTRIRLKVGSSMLQRLQNSSLGPGPPPSAPSGPLGPGTANFTNFNGDVIATPKPETMDLTGATPKADAAGVLTGGTVGELGTTGRAPGPGGTAKPPVPTLNEHMVCADPASKEDMLNVVDKLQKKDPSGWFKHPVTELLVRWVI